MSDKSTLKRLLREMYMADNVGEAAKIEKQIISLWDDRDTAYDALQARVTAMIDVNVELHRRVQAIEAEK